MKKEISEFRKFISRGAVLDMAVGVIIGGAFSKIVSSLVDDIFMPLLGVILGGLDFSGLSIKIGDASIMYGAFIQSIVDFLIIAICIFVMVKVVTKIRDKADKRLGIEHKKEEKKKDEQVLLLEEIRDLLKENGKVGKK
ncbi:MAG TPA: large-conductance mechanosensitive channel protein MscL [Candidatus Onthousia faecavium]|nr:large-conductance mechanosensitive channel protein MscL [Candidatus Onthousia faecavium]